jgi:hypothetical protein
MVALIATAVVAVLVLTAYASGVATGVEVVAMLGSCWTSPEPRRAAWTPQQKIGPPASYEDSEAQSGLRSPMSR